MAEITADGFEPSGGRGESLDRRMRMRLADSLDYVIAKVGPELGISGEKGAALTADIRARRQSPHRFGAYYDLVFALDGDDMDAGRSFASELVAASAASPRLASIEDRPAGELDRYRRLFLGDPAQAGAVDDADWPAVKARIKAALRLLRDGFPEMHDEIQALVSDIVIAADGGADGHPFGGASSFMLWGAALLNALQHRDRLEAAIGLAHESGHTLLFGFSADGPLVSNPDEERFGSPLREDLRPMDGIVHATYVIARMHQTLARLLDAGVLDEVESAAAREDLAYHARCFTEGDATIRESGLLTDTGRAAMDAARVYMSAASA